MKSRRDFPLFTTWKTSLRRSSLTPGASLANGPKVMKRFDIHPFCLIFTNPRIETLYQQKQRKVNSSQSLLIIIFSFLWSLAWTASVPFALSQSSVELWVEVLLHAVLTVIPILVVLVIQRFVCFEEQLFFRVAEVYILPPLPNCKAHVMGGSMISNMFMCSDSSRDRVWSFSAAISSYNALCSYCLCIVVCQERTAQIHVVRCFRISELLPLVWGSSCF